MKLIQNWSLLHDCLTLNDVLQSRVCDDVACITMKCFTIGSFPCGPLHFSYDDFYWSTEKTFSRISWHCYECKVFVFKTSRFPNCLARVVTRSRLTRAMSTPSLFIGVLSSTGRPTGWPFGEYEYNCHYSSVHLLTRHVHISGHRIYIHCLFLLENHLSSF